MAVEIYEVPDSFDHLFSNGCRSYRIINYNKGMDMDNIQSLQHFVEIVGIPDDCIEENLGTQITVHHPDYPQLLVIDSGGLGDFFLTALMCSSITLDKTALTLKNTA